jgi:hypothetical protein
MGGKHLEQSQTCPGSTKDSGGQVCLFPNTDNILQSIGPTSDWFFKADLTYGYWQVLLDAESSDLTTHLFNNTRYRYLFAPMGLSSMGDYLDVIQVDVATFE